MPGEPARQHRDVSESEACGGEDTFFQLARGPFGAFSSTQKWRMKSIEEQFVSGMNRQHLPLQVAGHVSRLEAQVGQSGAIIVTISLRFRSLIQIKHTAVPGRNLHALVTELREPFPAVRVSVK